MMLAADVTSGVVVGVIAVLSLTGSLRLWHPMALAALYGVGTASFDPAFDAIVPEILPKESLAQADSLDQFVRPIALTPGWTRDRRTADRRCRRGAAFGLDAATFVGSAAALLAMAARGPREQVPGAPHGSVVREIGAGFSYIRHHAWLWVTFVSAAIAYLLFMGPTEVLVPFLVKNALRGSAAELGLVFTAGRVGSVACAGLLRSTPNPATRHHVQVHLLDARHAGDRGLRTRPRPPGADARKPRLQRT